MDATLNVNVRRRSLKWLMNAILVLGLFAFSVEGTGFRPYNGEPIRTELTVTSRLTAQKTFKFKHAFDALAGSLLYRSGHPTDFTFALVHCGKLITAKRKGNLIQLPPKVQDAGFFLFYSFDRAEDGDMNLPRG